MKIAVSSDEYNPLLPTLFKELENYNHEYLYFGPDANEAPLNWTDVTLKAAEAVKNKQADEGIVLCWTGTGACMLANKVKGIRAALCVNGEIAKGARIWNHANILALSVKLTTKKRLKEILKEWFSTSYSDDAWNLSQISNINALDQTP